LSYDEAEDGLGHRARCARARVREDEGVIQAIELQELSAIAAGEKP